MAAGAGAPPTSMFGGLLPERPTALAALTGASSTVVAVAVANPWEAVKVRAQSQSEGWRMFGSLREFRQLLRKPFAGVHVRAKTGMQ